mmetsp:Transcript_3254/g.4877  ORF Transcript_3254/g.4877 Transcript_3254/m.4877 type:complete len:88 (-) Transcript_3254:234-497(-)
MPIPSMKLIIDMTNRTKLTNIVMSIVKSAALFNATPISNIADVMILPPSSGYTGRNKLNHMSKILSRIDCSQTVEKNPLGPLLMIVK